MSSPVSELFHVTVRVVLVAVRSVMFGSAGAVWRTEGGGGGRGGGVESDRIGIESRC